VGPFEEEEEVTGITSGEVKVEGEDPATTGCRKEDRVRRYVVDSKSWSRSPFVHSRRNPKTVTID